MSNLGQIKSKFLAHFAKIEKEGDVLTVLEQLKKKKKIAKATHNIYAYRIREKNGDLIEGKEDDGETKASEKLLFLLQKVNLENVLIIVTRWYGGIHLGGARFRHIVNSAHQLLIENKIIKSTKENLD
ncbi:protein impact [Anaeramoeba ignava]|uniref:Protein impact n=1 Tax=Anaeramoeba ignava TaxID=1746090 RepID=A0A9Q0LV09_ANAIG|nr:protein impact [Anaeramoeba ignava]